MQHDTPENAPHEGQTPPNPPPQPPAGDTAKKIPAADAAPKVEVEAEPTRGGGSGRVYDAPPPQREPPPNPFSTPASERRAPTRPSRGWAVATHLIGLLDFGVSFFGAGLIATTTLWLLKRGDDPEVDYHGRESLNLQLNILFWQIAAFPLILMCGLGLLILLISPAVKFLMLFYGAWRASRGDRWEYPFIVRVIN
jgi:uncharacterized Tic20 family protein